MVMLKSIRSRCVWTPGFLLFSLLLGAAAPLAAAEDEEPSSFAEAIREGRFKLNLRYRFEEVRDDVFAKDAHASTLRTTLDYSTRPWRGWSFGLGAENVAVLGDEDLYSNRGAGSLSNGVFDRPVVADPALTEIHQVFCRYERGETRAQLGRYEINLGDQRFVGAVGWRQNHQEFDALTVSSKLGRVELSYGFLAKVHRIFGDSKPMASHFLNAAGQLGGAGKLTLYGYHLDYDELADAGLSTSTYGAELKGARELGSGRELFYELELAEQSDAGDNPARIDAGYRHLLAGLGWGEVRLALGWEVLEGAPGEGRFQTPLATLHKWNGWADKFLQTPPGGLEDLYLTASGKRGAFEWVARLHEFRAESASLDYGRELDLQVLYRAPWEQVFGLKIALYEAEDFSSDTEKLIFWTTYGI